MSCYGCTNRHMYCHVSWEDYLKEKAERDALNEKIRLARFRDKAALGCIVQAHENFKMRSRKPTLNKVKGKIKNGN